MKPHTCRARTVRLLRTLCFVVVLPIVVGSCGEQTQTPLEQEDQSEPCGDLPVTSNNNRAVAFYNGNVITMAPVTRVDEAILVCGSRVAFTGSSSSILMAISGAADVIEVDLGGRTVMPGFVDAHSHWLQNAVRDGVDLAERQDFIVSRGTTTMGEPSIESWSLPVLEAWADAGNLKLRTNLYLLAKINVAGSPVDDWWKDVPARRGEHERLWIAGTKMFSDGGAVHRPAVSVEFTHAEPGESGEFGELYASADDIANFVRESQELGFQAVVHAIGDRAIDEALGGMEVVLSGGANPHRHRIDHNFVTRDDQLPRYSEIGVVPVVFGYLLPGHLETRFLGRAFGCPAAERNEFYQNAEGQLRKFLDANPGLPIAWQADDPPWPPWHPLWDLHNMVTRRRVFADLTVCEPPAWMAGTAITVEEALTMMTLNSAYALGREDHVGSLSPEKFADLIVLSDNPLTVDPRTIWEIDVQMTMIGGEVVFCMEGQESVCPREVP